MKKRLICALLAALMIVGLFPGVTAQAAEASELKTSKEAIEVLKELEGFREKAYADNGHYSIGYGTSCGKDEYPNGITKEKAEELLTESLAKMEETINAMNKDKGLALKQNEFDALMLFTYNIGPGWASANGDFRTAVYEGKTGNEFIYNMVRWCKTGETVVTGLINRRLAEADMYLNGYYAKDPPSHFTYVVFSACEDACESNVQGYDASQPVDIFVTPARTGYRFLGWYTEEEGGQWVTKLDATTAKKTLYAHWQENEGRVDENNVILGQEVRYERTAAKELATYSAPGGTAGTKKIAKNAAVAVVADYVDADGVKWGRLADGSWVKLADTTVKTTAATVAQRPTTKPAPEEEETPSIQVTVTASELNFRSGPGTNAKILSSLVQGRKINITEVEEVDGLKWGKFASGWVCLKYTNYETLMNMEQEKPAVIDTGYVKCAVLRVRAGAGTNYGTVSTLGEGTRVEIFEKKANGKTIWGKIAEGWVSLDYIQLDGNQNAGNTGSTDGSGDDSDATDQTPAVGGTVSASALFIRSGPGAKNKAVGSLNMGSRVFITATEKVDDVLWGKIDRGWICLTYVKLDGPAPKPEDTTKPDTGNDGGTTTEPTEPLTGTVTASFLCVRSGPGTNYAPQKSLPRGTAVTILKTTQVNTVTWGQIEGGWICMTYVKLDTAQTEPDDTTKPDDTTNPDTGSDGDTSGDTTTDPAKPITGKVTASFLCVRSGPGTGFDAMKSLPMGTEVIIVNTALVKGTVWGQIEGGWICMNYVELDGDSAALTFTVTVTASALCIRAAAGSTNAIRGTYTQGAVIKILQTTNVGGTMWGRTDKGWVCMDYVK